MSELDPDSALATAADTASQPIMEADIDSVAPDVWSTIAAASVGVETGSTDGPEAESDFPGGGSALDFFVPSSAAAAAAAPVSRHAVSDERGRGRRGSGSRGLNFFHIR
jgi:hypothetical protein